MHKPRKILRLGITLGDVNGIGPELLIRALSDQRLKEICTPIVYGSTRVLNAFRKILSVDKFSYNVVQMPNQAQPRKISVVDTPAKGEQSEVGKPSRAGGKAAFDALQAAVADLKTGELDALVTLPIDKHSIHDENFPFPGHTEYLAKEFDVEESLMFMVHEHLKVGVVTGHVPLKEVSSHLTVDKIVNKIKLMNQSLRMDFGIEKPRIAVLGLNPHAGDNGLIGKEEREKIERAIEQFGTKKAYVFGPYGADGFFGSGTFRKFDGILAMYHDQGLIPFKLLAGFEGVNFTAGLPAVRTSPDHGVAYDLAGKGVADIASFLHAIYAAIDIVRRRRANKDLDEGSIWNAPKPESIRPPRPKKPPRPRPEPQKDREDRGKPEPKSEASETIPAPEETVATVVADGSEE